MCIICSGLDEKTLTPWEAIRNSDEMWDIIDDEHKEELDERISLAVQEWLEENPDKIIGA
tara:strand:+ start:1523 stop:1702 length:180 start_codon:yes stop_codon:yes gene_type:complete